MKKTYRTIGERYIIKLIKECKKEFFAHYDLPNIKTYYSHENNCRVNVRYNSKGVVLARLYFDLTYLIIKSKNNKSVQFEMYPQKSIRNRLKFIIYHELSHYLQAQKYFKSYMINSSSQKKKIKNWSLNDYNYRKLPKELKADKMSNGFINRKDKKK